MSVMFELHGMICESGTFTPKTSAPRGLNLIFKEGDDTSGLVSSIKLSDTAGWFESTPAECGADTYEIVRATNDEATEFEAVGDGDVKIQDDLLTVNLDSEESFNNQLYLQATSLGGLVAQQRLQVEIKGSNNQCDFSAEPSPLDIAIDYEDGKKVNVVEEMQRELTLLPKGDAECPVNELVRYESSKGLIATHNYQFDAEEEGPRSSVFTVTEQVKYTYNVRTGGSTSFWQSNLVEATVTVCGKETITAKDGAQAIKLKQSDTAKYHVIGRDQYVNWFDIDASDENASAKCGINTVEIVEQTEGLPFVNSHQELMIPIENFDANTVATMKATTRGGQTATR